MTRWFAVVLFAAGWIAVASAASACGPKPMRAGPQASIDGAPHFIWPLRGRLMTDLCADSAARRKGIDIAVPEGTQVLAAADGIVAYAGGELKNYGNIVLIRHDGGWITAYAFARTLLVKRGDEVRQGNAIALSGHGIAAATPLLHFEILSKNGPVNPLRLLPQRHDG